MNNWSNKDIQKLGFVQKEGGNYVPVKSLIDKGKVKKLPLMDVKPNVKVKNAVKSVNDDGVKFDSNLERTMYNLLVGAGINFQFQYEYVIQPKFQYGGITIRPIKIRTDFWLPERNTIIDTKGFGTAISKLKYKLLKYWLSNKGEEPKIFMPGTTKECEFLISKLKYDKT